MRKAAMQAIHDLARRDKRVVFIGSDLGAAVKGFKSAMNEGESEEAAKQLAQSQDADFEAAKAREADKVPPKTNA